MEFLPILLSATLALLLVLQLLRSKKSKSKSKRLPPAPPGWPVIGNMFDLGSKPHQSMYKLRAKYGPVIWLKLGSTNTMVVQSAKAAEELLKNHDTSFCDRKSTLVFRTHNYNQGSLATGQYGAYWRMLRRICTVDLLSMKQIDDSDHLRRKCVDDMVRYIEDDAAAARAKGEAGEVNLAHYLFLMAFNLVGNLVLSRDLVNSSSREGSDFFDAMNKCMELAGTPNFADFLPFLKWLDVQRIMKDTAIHLGRAIEIAEGYVEERVDEYKLGGDKMKKDFLDVLLEYEGEGEGKISYKNIVILVLEMFFAGSETTSSTIEWGMAEMFRNLESMKSVKEELDRVVGPKRKVEESDIDQLPYLQAVVKETMRMYPVLPLLLPRNSLQDTEYMGYLIPKDTQVLVNAWAIGRDHECWKDPMHFKPERFLGSKVDYKGRNFEFIPFGSGRRICPGMSLASRVVHLAMASLIHSFDWELGSRSTPETMDMSEREGISLRKFIPLKAIPNKRIQ